VIVLGINGYTARDRKKGIFHDSGAAIVKDGKILAAVDEERLSRIKGDRFYPFGAIEAVLRISGISPAEIDHIAVPHQSRHKIMRETMRQLSYALTRKPRPEFRNFLINRIIDFPIRTAVEWVTPRTVPDELARIEKSEIRHHEAHAASAYYTLPWPEQRTLVITFDGFGDAECASSWIGHEGRMERKGSLSLMHSIGSLYTAFTHHLGFKALRHEGKIVGLAAYDDGQILYDRLLEHIDLDHWQHLFDGDLMQLSYCALRSGSDKIYAELTEGLSREQIAGGIQRLAETIVTRYAEEQVRLHGCSHVALAGGVFANVKLNQRIMAIEGVENVYVYPNMGDGGLAAGAALRLHAEKNPDHALPQFPGTFYFGEAITAEAAKAALEAAGVSFSEPENIAAETARLLADGKVVARADGGMEYGPRALGNRTVMAACSDPSINKWLNDRFQRTEFMPFAPVILEDAAQEYFPDWRPEHVAARFMTITYDASETAKQNIPAAVHVDGTARPQVLRREDNPGYYDIVDEYRKITGVPSVINTSFNMHEEPIVCTASDAVRAFLDAKLDALILGPYLAVK